MGGQSRQCNIQLELPCSVKEARHLPRASDPLRSQVCSRTWAGYGVYVLRLRASRVSGFRVEGSEFIVIADNRISLVRIIGVVMSDTSRCR